jgi:prevent-host-death family protein
MPKNVSVTEAKTKFSATLEWVVQNNEAVVIEVRGKPKAVILSYRHYEEYQALKEQNQQQEDAP